MIQSEVPTIGPGYTPTNIASGAICFSTGTQITGNSSSLTWDNTQLLFKITPGAQLGTFPANPSGPFASGQDTARIGEGRPFGNPTGTIVATPGAGSLTGAYQYAYIEWDVSGNHTGLSPITNVTAASNQYTLTVPLQRSGVIARSIVRTKAGGSTFYLLHNFASGEAVHQTIWVDNTADGSLTTPVTNADSTLFYKYVSNINSAYGGNFFCTHPDQTGVSATDLTIMTGTPGTSQGSVDAYCGISARAVGVLPAFVSRYTGTGSGNGSHLQCFWIQSTDNGTGPFQVYRINPQGDIVWTPNTTGVSNPTWLGLTGGVSGNYFVARLGASNSQAGMYVGASSEPYFGGNINYSGADQYSIGSIAPWRIGNPGGSLHQAFEIDVAAAGFANTNITWTSALTITDLAVATFGGNVTVPSGTAGSPSLNFSGDTTSGFYWSSGPRLHVTLGGVESGQFSSGFFFVNTIGFGLATQDTQLTRDAAGILALKNGNTAQTFRTYAGNGANLGIVTVNESLTIAASATTDSSTTIPAGAVILAVAVRVTTVIPTAATFTVTTATGGTTLSTAAVSTAASSTDLGSAAGALYTSAGTKVRITPNLTPGAATGVVRLAIMYYLPTAPTS